MVAAAPKIVGIVSPRFGRRRYDGNIITYIYDNQNRSQQYKYCSVYRLIYGCFATSQAQKGNFCGNSTVFNEGDAIQLQYVWGNYLDEVWSIDDRWREVTVRDLIQCIGEVTSAWDPTFSWLQGWTRSGFPCK